MTNQVFRQFHTIAAAQKLSAAAILLWQYVYFAAAAQNKYSDLHLRTADVMQALCITRNGLQKVRRTLVHAGLLKVHIDARQQVYYTLAMNGKPIDSAMQTPNSTGNNRHTATANTAGTKPQAPAKPYTPNAQYPGDIMQDGTYRKLITAFCSRYEPQERLQLELCLQQFLYQRKQKGKTLTKAGLDAILDKLVQLAKENVRTMVHIVEQSISRGWLGVYAYTGKSTPAPAKHTDTHRLQYSPQYPRSRDTRLSRIPAYDTAYVDLSFLER